MGVQIITKCGIVLPTSEKGVVASKRKHKKQTHKREERKDMKKKNNSTKVVAIATIAVVVLAGISAVSVSSLVKSDEARLGSISGIDSADSASGSATTRPEAELKVAGVEEVQPAVADEPVYAEEAPAAIIPVDVEVVVNDNVVEEKASPQDVPVIAVEQVEEPEVKEEPELLLAASEPVMFLAEAEPAVQEAVFEVVEEEYVPELVLGDGFTGWEGEAQEYDDYDEYDGYWEGFDYEAAAYEEPVYEEPVYVEPVYEEPVYVDPAADMEYVPEETAAAETVTPVSTGTTSGVRQDLVNYAMSRVGVTPYVWAGRSLDTGTDCSGFVNLIYDNFGYYASAGSDDYQNVEGDWGTNISYDELQVGDVVVYYDGGHVGIYAGQDEYGNDIVVHDSNEIDGVKVSEMNYSDPTAYVRIINE